MIGSPVLRGAVASVVRRACLAAASAVSAISAAIATSVTMAGGPQRRIATRDCTRFTMPCPGRNAGPRLRRANVGSRKWLYGNDSGRQVFRLPEHRGDGGL